jgi:fibronectin type 3 domain-containing protein
MLGNPQKFKQSLFLLLFLQFSVWAMMIFTGCGGSGHIPSAGILTSSEVTLKWQDVPDASAYNVYLSTSPGVTVLNSYKISNASNPITITDLEPGTTYFFVVTVEDNSGSIRKSKEISYKVVNTRGSIQFGDILSHTDPDAAVSESENVPEASSSDSTPAVMHGPQGRQVESTEASAPETRDVTLAWDDVPNATSYNIYWSDKAGVTRENGTKISNVKNPHKIQGLKKGGRYYFVVTAVNASGESKESEEFSFTVGQ